MNPFFKVLVSSVVLALLLLWGAKHFVLRTEELPLTLDVKSMAYLNRQTLSTSDDEVDVDEELVNQNDGGQPKPSITSPDESTIAAAEPELSPAAATPLADSLDSIDNPADSTSLESELSDTLSGTEAKNVLSGAAETIEEASTPQSRQRAVMERLGVVNKDPPPPTAAIDVKYLVPPECNATGVALAPVTVKFRFNSPSIKGESLNVLETLIAEYRRCQGGEFRLAKNPLGKVDESVPLTQRRLDELKYFFIQHSVPKTVLEYPEEL